MWVHVGNLVINLNQTSHLEVEEYDNYAYLMAYLATSNPGGQHWVRIAEGHPDEMYALLGGILGNLQAGVAVLDLDRWRMNRERVLRQMQAGAEMEGVSP